MKILKYWKEVGVASFIALLGYIAVDHYLENHKPKDEPTTEASALEQVVETATSTHSAPINFPSIKPEPQVITYHDLPEGDPVKAFFESQCDIVTRFFSGYETLTDAFEQHKYEPMSASKILNIASTWRSMLKLTTMDTRIHANLELCDDYEDRMWEVVDDIHDKVTYCIENDCYDFYFAIVLGEAHTDEDAVAEARDFVLEECVNVDNPNCSAYLEAVKIQYGEAFVSDLVGETYELDGLASASQVANSFDSGSLIYCVAN